MKPWLASLPARRLQRRRRHARRLADDRARLDTCSTRVQTLRLTLTNPHAGHDRRRAPATGFDIVARSARERRHRRADRRGPRRERHARRGRRVAAVSVRRRSTRTSSSTWRAPNTVGAAPADARRPRAATLGVGALSYGAMLAGGRDRSRRAEPTRRDLQRVRSLADRRARAARAARRARARRRRERHRVHVRRRRRDRPADRHAVAVRYHRPRRPARTPTSATSPASRAPARPRCRSAAITS